MASSLQITGTPAEIYEQHMVPAIFVRWAPDLVEAAGVWAGDRALDVACGTGVVTRLLAERVGPAGTVVGLDINPEMLAVARRRGAAAEHRVGGGQRRPYGPARRHVRPGAL